MFSYYVLLSPSIFFLLRHLLHAWSLHTHVLPSFLPLSGTLGCVCVWREGGVRLVWDSGNPLRPPPPLLPSTPLSPQHHPPSLPPSASLHPPVHTSSENSRCLTHTKVRRNVQDSQGCLFLKRKKQRQQRSLVFSPTLVLKPSPPPPHPPTRPTQNTHCPILGCLS